MTKILYLHGFASSADSTKAKVIESSNAYDFPCPLDPDTKVIEL